MLNVWFVHDAWSGSSRSPCTTSFAEHSMHQSTASVRPEVVSTVRRPLHNRRISLIVWTRIASATVPEAFAPLGWTDCRRPLRSGSLVGRARVERITWWPPGGRPRRHGSVVRRPSVSQSVSQRSQSVDRSVRTIDQRSIYGWYPLSSCRLKEPRWTRHCCLE